MKIILLLTGILTVLLTSNANASNIYSVDCKFVKGIRPELVRCENFEVVCYGASDGGSINCKFKNEVN